MFVYPKGNPPAHSQGYLVEKVLSYCSQNFGRIVRLFHMEMHEAANTPGTWSTNK